MEYNFQFDALNIPDNDLQAIREELYHSKGKGYVVFKNFLPKDHTKHLQDFWGRIVKLDEKGRLPLVDEREILPNGQSVCKHIYEGCPNYYRLFNKGKSGVAFYNYFWNTPHDKLTYIVTHQVQVLRNLITFNPVYEEIFPLENRRTTSCNIIMTKNADVYSPPHTDWDKEPNFEPKRLQATLFLSKKGVDYDGKGFLFRDNQGKQLEFDSSEVPIEAGDLVFWRYINEHSIQDIKSSGDQLGFSRIIFPPTYVFKNKPEVSFSEKYNSTVIKKKLKNKFLNSFFVQKIAVPAKRMIK